MRIDGKREMIVKNEVSLHSCDVGTSKKNQLKPTILLEVENGDGSGQASKG